MASAWHRGREHEALSVTNGRLGRGGDLRTINQNSGSRQKEHSPPTEAASMPAPFDLECKFELEHRTAVVPDFNRHLVAAVPWGPDGISGHIGKRARRLFLHLLYG